LHQDSSAFVFGGAGQVSPDQFTNVRFLFETNGHGIVDVVAAPGPTSIARSASGGAPPTSHPAMTPATGRVRSAGLLSVGGSDARSLSPPCRKPIGTRGARAIPGRRVYDRGPR
jgi:hypothetical protein